MTKKYKIERANEIKKLGLPISDENVTFLIDNVFSKHFEWEKKKGNGIDHIFFGDDGYGRVCYFIERKDGTVVDISVPKSLTKPKTKQMVKETLRYLIKPQIDVVRRHFKATKARCAISDEILLDNFHIDHCGDMEFDEIANEWLEIFDADELYLNSHPVPEKRGVYVFDDIGTCTHWYKFHADRAVYQATNPTHNLKKGKK